MSDVIHKGLQLEINPTNQTFHLHLMQTFGHIYCADLLIKCHGTYQLDEKGNFTLKGTETLFKPYCIYDHKHLVFGHRKILDPSVYCICKDWLVPVEEFEEMYPEMEGLKLLEEEHEREVVKKRKEMVFQCQVVAGCYSDSEGSFCRRWEVFTDGRCRGLSFDSPNHSLILYYGRIYFEEDYDFNYKFQYNVFYSGPLVEYDTQESPPKMILEKLVEPKSIYILKRVHQFSKGEDDLPGWIQMYPWKTHLFPEIKDLVLPELKQNFKYIGREAYVEDWDRHFFSLACADQEVVVLLFMYFGRMGWDRMLVKYCINFILWDRYTISYNYHFTQW
eukprot:TRINITY_DN8467_c0_g1_i1.p1 TRINITY_DN8467_c0_g1~~TRINITY_DN8467_c0_g1_i1.p1  ORF type:complete len:365 (-),score=80.84 TRINITY_DN8467_c0_g1_i1:177-1175(-)